MMRSVTVSWVTDPTCTFMLEDRGFVFRDLEDGMCALDCAVFATEQEAQAFIDRYSIAPTVGDGWFAITKIEDLSGCISALSESPKFHIWKYESGSHQIFNIFPEGEEGYDEFRDGDDRARIANVYAHSEDEAIEKWEAHFGRKFSPEAVEPKER